MLATGPEFMLWMLIPEAVCDVDDRLQAIDMQVTSYVVVFEAWPTSAELHAPRMNWKHAASDHGLTAEAEPAN